MQNMPAETRPGTRCVGSRLIVRLARIRLEGGTARKVRPFAGHSIPSPHLRFSTIAISHLHTHIGVSNALQARSVWSPCRLRHRLSRSKQEQPHRRAFVTVLAAPLRYPCVFFLWWQTLVDYCFASAGQGTVGCVGALVRCCVAVLLCCCVRCRDTNEEHPRWWIMNEIITFSIST